MEIIKNTTINEELIVTSKVTLTGEIIINSNIVVKDAGHLTVRDAKLYFDKDCAILISEASIEAISSTFDAKGLNWNGIFIEGEQSSNSIIKNCTLLNVQGDGITCIRNSDIVIDSCKIESCSDAGIMFAVNNGTIRNCTICDCGSIDIRYSGGIVLAKRATVIKCIIKNCKGGSGGGICVRTSGSENSIIENCIIENCKAKEGGGIFTSGGGKINKCKINHCIASENGGGIKSTMNQSLSIESTTVFHCIAQTYGGGISIDTNKAVFDDVEIVECKAKNGGGIHVRYSTKIESISTTKIVNCKSSNLEAGNAIYLMPEDGRMEINNFSFINCVDFNSQNDNILEYTTNGYDGSATLNNCESYNYSDGKNLYYDIKEVSKYWKLDGILEINGERMDEI